jgi:hypothetical protein
MLLSLLLSAPSSGAWTRAGRTTLVTLPQRPTLLWVSMVGWSASWLMTGPGGRRARDRARVGPQKHVLVLHLLVAAIGRSWLARPELEVIALG